MKYCHLKHHIQVVHSFHFPLHSLNTLLHNLLREKIVRLSNYFVIQIKKKHGFLLFFHLLDISSQLWSWVAAVLDCFTLPVYLFCSFVVKSYMHWLYLYLTVINVMLSVSQFIKTCHCRCRCHRHWGYVSEKVCTSLKSENNGLNFFCRFLLSILPFLPL